MQTYDIFRPLLLLALCAFLIGFLGYLAVAPARTDAWTSQGTATPASAPPAASGQWNVAKEI